MGLAKVQRIIDPYTIQTDDGRIFRLINIQYPDYDLSNPGPLSLAALKILRDMLEGQTIELFQTSKKDVGRLNRMGHHLAHILRQNDHIWVQGTLVSLGLAYAYPMQRNPEMVADLYDLESSAREQKLGIWDDNTEFKILSPDDAGEYLNSYQIIEGNIKSVALNKNRIFMNFGPDWRTDFTVSIAPADKRKFLKQGMDPQQWNNTKVRVRGWIRSYNGPYMEINQPESIVILDKKSPEDEALP